ncbi:MAG: hypothetical protein IT307_05805 [Chloroflexi bacterium]|nr:hypothetical protein [Chloroflexota bacterium]
MELPQAAAVYDRHLVKLKTPPLDPRVDIANEGQLAITIKMLGLGSPPGDPSGLIDNRIAEQALGAQT